MEKKLEPRPDTENNSPYSFMTAQEYKSFLDQSKLDRDKISQMFRILNEIHQQNILIKNGKISIQNLNITNGDATAAYHDILKDNFTFDKLKAILIEQKNIEIPKIESNKDAETKRVLREASIISGGGFAILAITLAIAFTTGVLTGGVGPAAIIALVGIGLGTVAVCYGAYHAYNSQNIASSRVDKRIELANRKNTAAAEEITEAITEDREVALSTAKMDKIDNFLSQSSSEKKQLAIKKFEVFKNKLNNLRIAKGDRTEISNMEFAMKTIEEKIDGGDAHNAEVAINLINHAGSKAQITEICEFLEKINVKVLMDLT